MSVQLIDIAEIKIPSYQVRQVTGDLTELTSSIERHGVIEPIIVRSLELGFELVAGFRRFMASKATGKTQIPALIRELSDQEAFCIQASENLGRQDLSEQEKTKLLAYYAEHYQKKPKEISQDLGVSYSWVMKYLPDKFKDSVKAEAGKAGGHATATLLLHGVNQTVKSSDNIHAVAEKCKKCCCQSYNLSPDGLCETCIEKQAQAKTVLDRVNKQVFNLTPEVQKTAEIAEASFKSTPIEIEEKREIIDDSTFTEHITFTKASESKEAQELCSCPVCKTILSKNDFLLCKEETAIKYGAKIQTKLFPEEVEEENTEAKIEVN